MRPRSRVRAAATTAASVVAAAGVMLLAAVALPCAADESSHSYQFEEAVIIYANKMGPFNNPLETYAYFELPGCAPLSWDHKFPSLGQALVGDQMYKMNVGAKFRQDATKRSICSFKPTSDQADRWRQMVNEQYWYQLYVDDLPIWATFGKVVDGVPNIYTHMSFLFGFNVDRLVVADLEAQDLKPISAETTYEFSYSVEFKASQVAFDSRFRRYLDNSFFEHRIHWFSIFNSFMMVLFLAGLVLAILMRTLRGDYQRIAKDREDIEAGREDWGEEGGWKQLHADVFRVPPHPALLCAVVGTGWHILFFAALIVLIAIVSVVYTSPGSFLTYAILSFVATAFAAGYQSSSLFSYYTRIGPNISPQWIKTMGLTAGLFPGYVLGSGFLLNFVAIGYGSAQAIPFGGMVVMVLLWLFADVPLVVIGTMVARHGGGSGGVATATATAGSKADIPHVNQIPRIIPQRRWFLQRWVFIVLGGILPFGSIFIELYFVFTSFWNYKLYYVYGFMLLVFIILLLVTACVSVVSTYFLLNSEDYRWPWTSFGLGGSVSVFVFLYACYFYFLKTKMSGFFMLVFYFSYMGMLCVGLGIMCGTVSFAASFAFVRRIYRNVKSD